MSFSKVSVHGGHSGSFCGHAVDSLGDVVAEYVAQGFEWVCLTEHMAPLRQSMMPPEEAAEGMNVAEIQARFERYFEEARRLQTLYRNDIDILQMWRQPCPCIGALTCHHRRVVSPLGQ